jgi:hypothetical protein
MCKPWNKLTKDEKQACVKKKLLGGFAMFLFGMLWMYFATPGVQLVDYVAGFISAFTVMGLLIILYGLVKKFSA